MANKVNTEWFDLQVKHGNYLPKEKQKTLYQEQKEMREKHQEENKLQNKLDQKDMNQLKEMEDDLDFDDEFMREYMSKRKAELVEKAHKHRYGQVIEISRDQYVKQVTEANPEDFVVIHLYQDSNQYCGLINQYLNKLAADQPHIKFVKMVSTKCIQNFPDSKCPCFIIYKAGKPVSNIVNVDLQIDRDVNKLPNFLLSQGVNIE